MNNDNEETKTQDNGGDASQPNGSGSGAGQKESSSVLPSSGEGVVLESKEASSVEDNELKEHIQLFESHPKLKRWAELFTDKNNKATYGNRTESAVQAGYDCHTRVSFANVGAQNFKKLYGLASLFVEDKGVTMEKIMSTVTARALTHENPKWFELFTEMIGVRDPKGVNVNVVNNTQNNQINVSGVDQTDFNEAFKDFLKQE